MIVENNANMNLAFCLFNYFPYGGLQRDFIRIAEACLQRGHSIDVYTMRWEGPNLLSLPVFLIPARGFQNHSKLTDFSKKLKTHLAHKNYDLIVGFNKMPGLDVYYCADTCFQANAQKKHGHWYRFTPRYRSLAALERAVFDKIKKTQILLLSALQQPDFEKFYGTSSARFHLLPPGISKNRIAPDNATELRSAIRKSFRIHSNELLLLMVGSGFKTKGLDRSLKGLASLPTDIKIRCHLWIAGQDDPDSFIRQAKQLGIVNQVKFLGGCDDIPQLLLAADVLLHPAYNENTGTVLLEALASGLPVLTTDVCGYAHYIEQANAGIVLKSPFQQTNFNFSLLEILQSPLLPIWKKNGIHFAQTTDIYSLHEQAVNILENLGQLRIANHPMRKQDSNRLDEFANLSFSQTMNLRGEIFRELEGRRTQRIMLGNSNYFIKQHFGIGWKEIFKNLIQLRLPVISAKNEWLALQRLHELAIPTMEIVAYGMRGFHPAKRQSFLITKELVDVISLEDLENNRLPSAYQMIDKAFGSFCLFKRQLISKIGKIAKTLHDNGLNHRDFYLCHFLLDLKECSKAQIKLYLIDLHRAQIRSKTPKRWIVKDLAGLYFSSKESGLTQRDILRFMKHYCEMPLRDIFKEETHFWQKVKNRGDKLYRQHRNF